MAQKRARAERQHRSEEVRTVAQMSVADREDVAVNRLKPAVTKQTRNGAAAEAKLLQLRPSHHPALTRRQPSQLTTTPMVKRTATVQSTIRVAHPPTMTPKPTLVGDL